MTNEDEATNVLGENIHTLSIERFIEEIRNRLGFETTVSITIFINSEGFSIEEKQRTLESLKSDGISMKNVFGTYIR